MRDKGTIMITIGLTSMVVGFGLALVFSGIIPSVVTKILAILVFVGFIVLAKGVNYHVKSEKYIDDDL